MLHTHYHWYYISLFYARAPVPSLCNQSKILVKSPSRRDGTNFLSSCLPLSFSFSPFSLFRDLPRPQTALLFSPGLSEARNLHARSTLTLPPYLCVACLGKLFHQRNFAIVCFLVVVFFYFSEEKEGPTMTSMNFSRACSLKRTFVERGCLTTSVLPRAKVLKKTSWGVKCLHIF